MKLEVGRAIYSLSYVIQRQVQHMCPCSTIIRRQYDNILLTSVEVVPSIGAMIAVSDSYHTTPSTRVGAKQPSRRRNTVEVTEIEDVTSAHADSCKVRPSMFEA